MPGCETTDFMFPMLADVYYPITEQTVGYGNVTKRWVLDRSVACYFASASSSTKEDVKPETNIVIDNSISGRSRSEITQSTRGDLYSLTNIIVTNIRDNLGNVIYNESSGPRVGLPTIYEVATMNPSVGPFGRTEFFKIVLRRSENQYADL
jgi:hypothetical protein